MSAPINVPVIIEKIEKNYQATSPLFPGCAVTGATSAEAICNMQEALRAHIRAMQENGQEIPEGVEFVTTLTIPVGAAAKKMSAGQRLREWRKSRGLTQEQLAQKFNVVKATVSDWETDKRELPGAVAYILSEIA